MRRRRIPPASIGEWIEFFWLLVTDPVFQATRNKRRAYYEHRLAKIYSARCL